MTTSQPRQPGPQVRGNGMIVLPDLAASAAAVEPIMGAARVDRYGRVSDSTFFRAAGWAPGITIDVHIEHIGVILLARHGPRGRWTAHVTQPGQVVLPAAARRLAGLRTGTLVVLRLNPGSDLCRVADARAMAMPAEGGRS